MSNYSAEFVGNVLNVIFFPVAVFVAGAILKGTKSEGGGWINIVVAWGLAVTFAILCRWHNQR